MAKTVDTEESLKKNVAINCLGRLYEMGLNFFLVPVYISFVGVEAFGLVGLFLSLKSLSSILNFGLGTAAMREVSRAAAVPELHQDVCRTIASVERVYSVVGIVVAVVWILLSGYAVHGFVKVEHLSAGSVFYSFVAYGLLVGLIWPVSLYQGILRGLEKQSFLATRTIVLSTISCVVTLLSFKFIAPTVVVFVVVQVFMAVVERCWMATSAWRFLTNGISCDRSFSWGAVKPLWRFSAGMSVVSLCALLVKQADRLILGLFFSVTQLGYFNIARSGSSPVEFFENSISKAVSPRLTKLVAAQDYQELLRVYRLSTKILATAVSGVGFLMCFFSRDFLMVWTRSEDIANHAYLALSVLSVSVVFNAVMNMPWSLVYAQGKAKLAVANHVSSVLFLIPLMYVLISWFGLVGAALSWLAYNLAMFFAIPFFVHKSILVDHLYFWYVRDTLPFFLFAAFCFGCFKSLAVFARFAPLASLGVAMIVYVAYVMLCIWGDSILRGYAKSLVRQVIKRCRKEVP